MPKIDKANKENKVAPQRPDIKLSKNRDDDGEEEEDDDQS